MLKITLRQDGVERSVTISDGKPLLMALEAAGEKMVPVGCRGGGCGICRVQVISGEYEAKKMNRRHVDEEDSAKGITLACRTIPKSDLVIALATPKTIVKQQQKTESANLNATVNKEVLL